MTIAARQTIAPLDQLTAPTLPAYGIDIAQHPSVDVPRPRLARPDVHLPLLLGESQDLFSRQSQASYYVGIIAAEGAIYMPDAYLAARRLRYDTYHGYGLLAESDRDLDGGEHDEYDDISAHFGVVKNKNGTPQLIAYGRQVINRSGGIRLQVEEDYPEVFEERTSGPNVTESSRLVSMSRNPKERGLASAALQRAMLGWGVNSGFELSYAMVDEVVIRQLNNSKIPYTPLSEYKYIPKYNSATKVISINPVEALKKASVKNVLKVPLATTMFFNCAQRTQGLGYYGAHLIRYYGQGEEASGVANN